MNEIYHTYIIEHGDDIIYVGMTQDLKQRKNSHFNRLTNSKLSNFINSVGSDNVTMTSIGNFNQQIVAITYEKFLIMEFKKMGYPLLNINHPKSLSELIETTIGMIAIPDKKTMYDRLRIKCLSEDDLYNYLIWRNKEVGYTQLIEVLKDEQKIDGETMRVIEEWLDNPINPQYYKTKPQ